MCKSQQHSGKLKKLLLLLTLWTHPLHTDTPRGGQTHSHTRYIHFSLDIPTGGIRSLLRNNWHSVREYTAGICPWFPCLAAASTALAWQWDMSPDCSLPNQPNTYRHPLMGADSGMQRDGPHPRFAQLAILPLMISSLNSPLRETLTHVISRQICRASTQFSDWHEVPVEDSTCQVRW